MEKIKQQTSLFKPCESDLSMLYMLIQIYSITSAEDIETRSLFLKMQGVGSKICDAIKELLPKGLDLPQDSRWLLDAVYKDRNLRTSNLAMLAMVLVSAPDLWVKDKEGEMISYLKDVRSRKKEAKIDDIVVTEALNLLEKYDDFLRSVIDRKPAIDDKLLTEALSLIRWRYVFYNSINITLSPMNSLAFQEMLVSLHVHYKWFSKYSIRKFQELLHVSIDGSFHDVLSKVDETLSQRFSALAKTAKAYRRAISQPPPLINRTQLSVIPVFHEVASRYDICNKRNDFNKLIGVLLENKTLRADLVDLKSRLDYEFSEVPEGFHELKKFDLLVKSSAKENEVKLLPLYDYFIKREIFKTWENFDIKRLNFVTIPCNLAGVLLRYKKSADARVRHEINTEIYYYLMYSAAHNPHKYFNFKNEDSEDEVFSLLHFSPVLTYLISQLLNLNDHSKSNLSTSFGGYKTSIKQQRTISLLLWRNIRQICITENDYL